MSELLPNLSDLIEALPTGASAADLKQLTGAAKTATSESELDAVIVEVISEWLTK